MTAADLAPQLIELLDQSSVGVTIVAVEGAALRRVYVNAAAAEIMGYSRDELADMPPMFTVIPSEKPRLEAMARDFHAGREVPARIATVIVKKDGGHAPVEIVRSTVPCPGGGYLTMALFADLSERVRAEEALRQSETRFRNFAEHAPDTITVISRGRFVYANPAAVRVLGFDSAEELCARPLDRLVVPEEVGPMMQRMRQVHEGGRVAPTEYRGVRKDGSIVPVEIHSVAIQFEGQPAVMAFGRDVSERKRLQAELMRADRMATIGLLAASVAHEINNPLAYLLLNLQRLHARLEKLLVASPACAEVLELLADAREGGERVSAIVRDLLAFSRPDADAPPGAVDVTIALEAALRLAGNAVTHHASVVRRYQPVPHVIGHDGRLTQVFLNLIVNAAQAFSRPTVAENEIQLGVLVDGSEVVVEVSDNGPGIAAEHLALVFDPFFTTKGPSAGTGLGLTISRSIVEAYGGRIEAEGRAGGGTTLRARLRLATLA